MLLIRCCYPSGLSFMMMYWLT